MDNILDLGNLPKPPTITIVLHDRELGMVRDGVVILGKL